MSKKQVNTNQLPVNSRPYERCCEYGPQVLTDSELLAVVIRCGFKGKNSIELATEILKTASNAGDLTGLMHISLPALMKIKGIGKVKAIQIQCVCELSKRIAKTNAYAGLNFNHPRTIAAYYMEQMRHNSREELIVCMLDTKCRLIKDIVLSRGTVNASLITPREVFLEAFRYEAVFIVLIHNHPSGDPTPSSNDSAITKRIQQCGELMGITLLDHIIIGDNSYTSFRENDLLN